MAAVDLSSLLSNLSVTPVDDEDSGLKGQLVAFIAALPDDLEDCPHSSEVTESLSGGPLLSLLKKGLDSKDEDINTSTSELIAKIAKCEVCRCCPEMVQLVPSLVAFQKNSSKISSLVQATRALGNICYEHDGGREAVLKDGGSENITKLLNRALDWPCVEESGEQTDDGVSNYEDVHELRLVITGFILNLTNSCDSVTGSICTETSVEALSQFLDRHCDEEDIPTHTLLALACMADSPTGRQILSDVDLSPQIVSLLTHNLNPDVIEACLELTTTLAELDICKVQFAKGGVCGAVIEVVKRYVTYTSENLKNNPGSSAPVADTSIDSSDCNTDFCWQAIIQTATDLIVLILLGDSSMPIIYGEGQGPVFLQLVSWLRSDVEQLQVAAALAMGNFARTDAQSIALISLGVSQSLLILLSQNSHKDGRIVVQHAALAALRNLTIAQENKKALLAQGAMQVLLPLALSVETFPVVFKLLATLRMLIDGHTDAAIMVGTCVPVMQKVLHWCSVDEHPGVKGEASRLLAWIIKNAIAGGLMSSEDGSKQPKNSETEVLSKEASAIGESDCDTSKDKEERNIENNKDQSAVGPETIGIPVGVAVLHSLVEAGCLAPMLEMLQSEYPVMIHEASLALSLCTSVCMKLPKVVELISADSLAKGIANAAEKGSAGEASKADSPDAGVSHAMYNLLVACLAISDMEGGVSLLQTSTITNHITPLASSSNPHVKLAAESLLKKL